METPKVSVYKIADTALAITKKHISKTPENIVEVKEKNGEWLITVEVLERKSIPDTQDILGRYQIKLDKDGELLGWTQIMTRKRCDRITSDEATET